MDIDAESRLSIGTVIADKHDKLDFELTENIRLSPRNMAGSGSQKTTKLSPKTNFDVQSNLLTKEDFLEMLESRQFTKAVSNVMTAVNIA